MIVDIILGLRYDTKEFRPIENWPWEKMVQWYANDENLDVAYVEHQVVDTWELEERTRATVILTVSLTSDVLSLLKGRDLLKLVDFRFEDGDRVTSAHFAERL